MSSVRTFLLGGAVGAAFGFTAGAGAGAQVASYFTSREYKEKMKHFDIKEVKPTMLTIQASFQTYADLFGKGLNDALIKNDVPN
ncbi:MAG: hypothetical protein JO149_06605, partial [Gammaproteobacteria bacterium]|nr:hypothetical protein [Gammaproteobacteria bacterium]